MTDTGINQALLIIDVQNDYFEGGKMALCAPLAALKNIKRALRHFREQGKPVIHVQHINTGKGATFFLPDTQGALIHEHLTPRKGEHLVVKHAPNSFQGTNLAEIIREQHITEVVICGMMSHMCVDSTTRACFDSGIKTTLLADACATKDLAYQGQAIPAEMVHGAFMAALGRFADVVTTSEWTGRL